MLTALICRRCGGVRQSGSWRDLRVLEGYYKSKTTVKAGRCCCQEGAYSCSSPGVKPSAASLASVIQGKEKKMSLQGKKLLTVYIVTYKTEQQDMRIGAVYTSLERAKKEAARLETANKYGNVGAGVEIRECLLEDGVLDRLEEYT